jgi:hypothetical protein
MMKADIRIESRSGCVPGRYSRAGSAVWLMTKASANPHGIPAWTAAAADERAGYVVGPTGNTVP